MENGDIVDGNIKASSKLRDGFSARFARLNGTSTWATAAGSNSKPWIQADIGYQTYVSGVVTQGEGHIEGTMRDWVTAFNVSTFNMTTSDEEVFVKDGNGEVKVKSK